MKWNKYKMVYRLATENDITEIIELVKNAIIQMEKQGVFQWDNIYPTEKDFLLDIKKQQLFVGVLEGEIAVIYAVNNECDEAYQNGNWKYPDSEYRVIHRLCVNPKYQNKGVAKAALKYIENKLRTENIETIRLDVYSENPFALSLYANNGYEKVGFADWRKGRFLLMEKKLFKKNHTEVWELVDINENKTGVMIERGTDSSIPEGMYHMAVDIWVKGKDGKFLLTQRHPGKPWGLKWECSGGAIVKGESPVDGAIRELKEETGIQISEEELVYLGKTVMEEYQCIMYTYLVQLTDDVELNLQAEEVVDAKWVESSELEKRKDDIVDSVWERYLQFKEKMSRKVTDLQPWECLMKQIVWKQLGDIRDKKILDFGSGIGVTANYLAEYNDVTAIEPDEDSIKERWADNQYIQIVGSTDKLRKFDDETFDMIICHNVLEYAEDREDIVKEFARILKKNGKLSIVKHNRTGRVMQMVVLLNNFEHAHSLLDGNDGMASKYGAIHYYEDTDIQKWCPKLAITKTLGMRTFWDLQQNQEIHKDADWQDKMVEIEMRVSDMDGYKDIAFFHHLIIERK